MLATQLFNHIFINLEQVKNEDINHIFTCENIDGDIANNKGSTNLYFTFCLYNYTCSFCIFIGRELCVIKVHAQMTSTDGVI